MPGYAVKRELMAGGSFIDGSNKSESRRCAPVRSPTLLVQPGGSHHWPRPNWPCERPSPPLRRQDRLPSGKAYCPSHPAVALGRPLRSARVGSIEISSQRLALPYPEATCRYAERAPNTPVAEGEFGAGLCGSAPLPLQQLGVHCLSNCPDVGSPARAGHKFWLGGVGSRRSKDVYARSAAP